MRLIETHSSKLSDVSAEAKQNRMTEGRGNSQCEKHAAPMIIVERWDYCRGEKGEASFCTHHGKLIFCLSGIDSTQPHGDKGTYQSALFTVIQDERDKRIILDWKC